jgi:hypothetical protein
MARPVGVSVKLTHIYTVVFEMYHLLIQCLILYYLFCTCVVSDNAPDLALQRLHCMVETFFLREFQFFWLVLSRVKNRRLLNDTKYVSRLPPYLS